MTLLEQFAASLGPDTDVTHLVRVGTRDAAEVYAFGYWSPWAYHHGIVDYSCGKFGKMTVAYDILRGTVRAGEPAVVG